MPKQNIKIILKNGAEFVMECDSFECSATGVERFNHIGWGGATKNIPLYLDMDEVVAVLQEEINGEEDDHIEKT